MLQSDALDFCGDSLDGAGFNADDMSIDIDRLFEILNEDADPSSPEDSTYKNIVSCNFACAPVKYEDASPSQDVQQSVEAQVEGSSFLGSIPRFMPCHFNENHSMVTQDLGILDDVKENFSSSNIYPLNEVDQKQMERSLDTDGKFSRSGNYFSSSGHEYSSRYSASGSLNSMMSSNVQDQFIWNESSDWSTHPIIASGEVIDHFSDYTTYANGTGLGSEIGNGSRHMKSESSYQMEAISEEDSLVVKESALNYADRDMRGVTISPHAELDSGHVADVKCEGSGYCSPVSFCGGYTSDAFDASFADRDSRQFFPDVYHQESMSNDEQKRGYVMNERNDNFFIPQSICSSNEIYVGLQEGNFGVPHSVKHVAVESVRLPDVHCSVMRGPLDASVKCEASGHCSPVSCCGNCSDVDDGNSDGHALGKLLPAHCTSILDKSRVIGMEEKKRHELAAFCSIYSCTAKGIDSMDKCLSRSGSCDDSDTDVCILEEISDPGRPRSLLDHGKLTAVLQRSTFSEPLHHPGMGLRLKADDERLAFHAALQDLSQTKSEANPPNGLLAVPLLRHQRIALSWMVQKETASLHCSGGILADDQGLGKTLSTIALILRERPSFNKVVPKTVEKGEFQAFNLDDDDEEDGVLTGSVNATMTGGAVKRQNLFVPEKGRPAAGTLVVCPTSVLRQWAEELHNKVTREAHLSVLVYHGSNRTKDPDELAKHDVVLTTYSIVSMEVPKQPLLDQEDEKVRLGNDGVSLQSTSRKRKYPPCKRSAKNKKGTDSALLESVVRPLAKVGWFRVVLDEAQSIKNHRTQVARACWGLRAKRRWCLSGTPIQNAIDDLYSYFRFLRYDPYAVYKSFCSTIKGPIQRNPTNGYKKLQAVLKTVMLRRTKGTLIDGKPIINLPPKFVSLKKVDFSDEERDFYSRLEADSRAQFKVYADAGTVKQNYVNILLMLLRLRQACDHPLLVKGVDSISVWNSSLEAAKKLPREKQLDLLNCLEDGLAICSICNDPPEDAVVTVCSHVFCNQCICEHLTGDDNQCPGPKCKVHLGLTSVFSKASLRTSLSDQPSLGNHGSLDYVTDNSERAYLSDQPSLGNHGCLDYVADNSDLVNNNEICDDILFSDSSKIKAALEILRSLSKASQSTSGSSWRKSGDDFTSSSASTSDSSSVLESHDHNKSLVMSKDSRSPVVEKAIVFSQWTRMLDLLEARLKNSSIQYRRLDGTMSVLARDKAVKDFNNVPEVSVMIMSLKAASLGLNMVAACHVLLLDLWWNPTTEDQAIDRAHRIGQTRPVTVSRLTVRDTVEDRILALQERKRTMVASAFGEDGTGGSQTRLTVEDLQYLFMA